MSRACAKLLCLTLMGAAGLTGCATTKDGKPTGGIFSSTPVAQSRNDRYKVTAPRAPFYFYGPAQKHGPDLGLVKGEKVQMIKREKLFSQVKTSQGHEGYIATEYLELLPPEPAAVPFPMEETVYASSSFRPGKPRPLPELTVVPLDVMLAEPPLPSGGPTTSPATDPTPLIPTTPLPSPSPDPSPEPMLP